LQASVNLYTKTDRQTDRQADRQAGRQTDRQAGMQEEDNHTNRDTSQTQN